MIVLLWGWDSAILMYDMHYIKRNECIYVRFNFQLDVMNNFPLYVEYMHLWYVSHSGF